MRCAELVRIRPRGAGVGRGGHRLADVEPGGGVDLRVHEVADDDRGDDAMRVPLARRRAADAPSRAAFISSRAKVMCRDSTTTWIRLVVRMTGRTRSSRMRSRW